MNTFFKAALLSAIAVSAPLSAAMAEIKIEAPYARASGLMAKTGAAFMTIVNTGDEADRMIAASSDISGRVELHTHIKENGIMKMREVENGFPVEAHSTHALERGADHVMFLGLNRPMKDGESFDLTLTFEKAGDITITVPVDLSRGQMGAMPKTGGDMDASGHGKMMHAH